MRFLIIVILVCTGSLSCVKGQKFDETFGPALKGRCQISSLEEASDGNILVAGNFDYLNDAPSGGLIKIDRSGNAVNTFHKVFTDRRIIKTKILSDGKILIQGDFTRVNGVPKKQLARLNSDGTLDSDFTADSSLPINDFAIQSDGKIIVSPTFNGAGLIRLHPNGARDYSFEYSYGRVIAALKMFVDEDDNIYIADTYHIQRLNKKGSLDNSFTVNSGVASNDSQIHTISAGLNGKIFAGGTFTKFSGSVVNGLVRLNHDGSIDNTFKGFPPSASVTVIKQCSTGEILVGGKFSYVVKFSVDGTTQENIAFHYPNDITFLEKLHDDKIIVSGWFTSIRNSQQSFLALLNSDNSVNLEFVPKIRGAVQFNVLGITQEGKIVSAGGTEALGNLSYMSRFNADGTFDESFQPGFSNQSEVLSLQVALEDKILVSGWLRTIEGKIVNFARLNSDGSVDESFRIGTGPNGPPLKMRFNGSEIFLSGNFNLFNGVTTQSFVILNHQGEVVQSFLSIPEFSTITNFDFQSDGKIIAVGSFLFPDKLIGMLRLNRDGTIDKTFPLMEFDSYTALKIDAKDRIYAGGMLAHHDGEILVRFNPNGSLDKTFKQGSLLKGLWVSLIDILPTNELVIGGFFDTYNDHEVNGLVIVGKDNNEVSYPSPLLGRSSVISQMKYSNSNIFIGGKISFDDGKKTISIGKIMVDKDKIINPHKPSNLATTNGEALLRWNDKSDAEDGYEIERMDENSHFKLVEIVPASTTAFIDNSIDLSDKSIYRIRSFNAKDKSDYIYSSSNSLIIYPNPTIDQVTLKRNMSIKHVRVTNQMGQAMSVGSENFLGDSDITLDLSHLPSGMYVVSVQTGSKIVSEKIIKR